jgi:hypothetical protein
MAFYPESGYEFKFLNVDLFFKIRAPGMFERDEKF